MNNGAVERSPGNIAGNAPAGETRQNAPTPDPELHAWPEYSSPLSAIAAETTAILCIRDKRPAS
jgi:hypothetical protein